MLLHTLATLLFTCVVHAASLSAPFDLENTLVLPKGVNDPRIRVIQTQMSQAFNASGTVEPLGAGLNKKVTWDQVVNSQESTARPIARASINSICSSGTECEAKGYGPGETTGDARVNLNVMVPTFVRGITNSTSVIVAVPIYTVSIDSVTGFSPSPSFSTWMNTFKNDAYQQGQIKANFVDPVNSKATFFGYKAVESQSFQNVGDVKVGAKTRLFLKGKKWIMALKYLLTLPTGVAPDADKVIDVPTGDGGYALGLTAINEYYLGEKFCLTGTLGYGYQFQDQLMRRIPLQSGESLSPDKENLSRKRGNQYLTGLSFLIGRATKGFSTGAGYAYQYMEPTRYSGNNFAKERYGYLEELSPSQSMQSATLLVQYSTIYAYQTKKFILPLTASFSYSNVFAGINVPKSDLFSSELVLYF